MAIDAGTYKSIDAEFFLDEALLRKIVSVVYGYEEKLPFATQKKFRVFKEDGSFFLSDSLEDVLRDDNSSKKRIRRVVVEVTKTDKPEPTIDDEVFSIDFDMDNDNKTFYRINDPDRNRAFLFANDLDAQLERCKRGRIWVIAAGYWVGAATYLAISIAVVFGLYKLLGDDTVRQLLRLDASQPLHYADALIVQTKIIIAAAVGILVMSFLRYWEPLQGIAEHLSNSVFYWGDEIVRYKRAQELKNRVVWGLVVAFIVSLIAGLLVTYVS